MKHYWLPLLKESIRVLNTRRTVTGTLLILKGGAKFRMLSAGEKTHSKVKVKVDGQTMTAILDTTKAIERIVLIRNAR